MKILFFSDLHGHSFKQYSEETAEGINSRLNDCLLILDEIKTVVQFHKVDTVIFGGDLFHYRNPIQVPNFNLVIDRLFDLKSCVSNMCFLVGNHDQTNKIGTIHTLQTLHTFATVMDEVAWYYCGGDTHVFAIPYTDNKENIKFWLDSYRNESISRMTKSLLVGHFGVSGAKVGSDYVLLESKLPTLDFFEGCKNVFLGHYHMPQHLTQEVRYIGATHQHNWSDACQIRGVLILDQDTNNVEFVALDAAPKFIAFPYNSNWEKEEVIEGNFIRVVYDNFKDSESWEDVSHNLLNIHNARWVEYIVKNVEDHKHVEVSPTLVNSDMESLIRDHAYNSQLDDVRKERLYKLGMELFESRES